MAKLGFLGLGLMGYPMARNLVRAGHQVAVWSHTASKAKQLAQEEKAIACDSPAQVAEQAECVFACVGDTRMSEEVLLGTERRDRRRHAGNRGRRRQHHLAQPPAAASARSWRAKGIHFLDAPCTGSTPGATNATLTFMIGGDQSVFEKTKPYLRGDG